MRRLTLIALITVLAAPLLLLAATNHTTFTISDPVQVAGVTLQPGDFKVEWQGSGDNVNVSFSQNGKQVVSTTARMQKPDMPDQAKGLEMNTDNGQTVLKAIMLHDATLLLENQSTQPPASR